MKALASQSDDDLRALGGRLAKSLEQLTAYHEELLLEKQELMAEREHTNSTIGLLLQETHKLNIGADHLVEPELQEGPLDFVGRFWEQVRPRTNQVLISEHVGDLRKPELDEEGKPVETPSPLIQQFEELSSTTSGNLHAFQETAAKRFEGLQSTAQTRIEELRAMASQPFSEHTKSLSEAAMSLRERAVSGSPTAEEAKASLQRQAQELKESTTERLADMSKAFNEAKDRFRGSGGPSGFWQQAQQAVSGWSVLSSWGGTIQRAPQPEDAARSEEPSTLEEAEEPAAGILPSPSAASAAQKVAGNEPAGDKAEDEGAERKRQDDERKKVAEDVLRRKQQEAEEERRKQQEADDDAICATTLIEAHITIEDGTVQVARVLSTDRSRDVAAAFVSEYSLKAWFEEPLCLYLKNVESQADKFPVRTQAELSEIRKQFSRK